MAKAPVTELEGLQVVVRLADAVIYFDQERALATEAEKRKDYYKRSIHEFLKRDNIVDDEVVDIDGEFEVWTTRPEPRRTVRAEKLLALGVPMDIIEQATDVSVDTPRLNVKKKKKVL